MNTPATSLIVTRTPATTYQAEMAWVDVALACGSYRIEISGPKMRSGYLWPSTVNWSAFGAVSVADALAYAAALALAAAIAPTLSAATDA